MPDDYIDTDEEVAQSLDKECKSKIPERPVPDCGEKRERRRGRQAPGAFSVGARGGLAEVRPRVCAETWGEWAARTRAEAEQRQMEEAIQVEGLF